MSLRQFRRTATFLFAKSSSPAVTHSERFVHLTSVQASHQALRINYLDNGKSSYIVLTPAKGEITAVPCRSCKNLPKHVKYTSFGETSKKNWNKHWMITVFVLTAVLTIAGLRESNEALGTDREMSSASR